MHLKEVARDGKRAFDKQLERLLSRGKKQMQRRDKKHWLGEMTPTMDSKADAICKRRYLPNEIGLHKCEGMKLRAFSFL